MHTAQSWRCLPNRAQDDQEAGRKLLDPTGLSNLAENSSDSEDEDAAAPTRSAAAAWTTGEEFSQKSTNDKHADGGKLAEYYCKGAAKRHLHCPLAGRCSPRPRAPVLILARGGRHIQWGTGTRNL